MPYADPDKRRQYDRDYQASRKTRVHRVNCTLSAQEYQTLVEQADLLGLSPTACFREHALASMSQLVVLSPEVDARFNELMRVVRGVGNNINQMARHSNTVRHFVETEELQFHLRKLHDAVDACLTELRAGHDH